MSRFPQTKSLARFYNQVRQARNDIMKGKMVAIDPATGSSSYLGYAYFDKGKLVEKGVINIPKSLPLFKRLQITHEELKNKFNPIDVLIIECLAGMKNDALKFVTGVTMVSIEYEELIFLKPRIWHIIRPPNYIKSDEDDAELIGLAAIEICKELI